MKKNLLFLSILFSFFCNAQNPSNIDLVVGSGFVGLNNSRAIELQTDGKIIIGGIFNSGENGTSTTLGRVLRYNSDGSIDTTFPTVTLTNSGYINDIALQSDGKILIAGNFSTVNGQNLGSLVRLNVDGSIDITFLANIYNGIYSIAVQPDDKIILGGIGSYNVNGHSQKSMARLNPNGTIDNTFDLGTIGFTQTIAPIYKVVVQPDGKIIAAGSFSVFNNIAQGKLIRFNPNGSKDINFNIGTGATDSNTLNDIVLQSDGKIIISGGFGSFNGQAYGRLCRLNTDGSIDTSYVNFFNSGTPTGPSSTALQSDGKLIVVGGFLINNQTQRIARINTDGSLDTTFINSVDNSSLNCMAIQSNNKIIVGGFMSSDKRDVLINGVGRLNADGTKDGNFNLNTGLNDEVNTIVLQTNNKTILGGSFTTFDGVPQNKIIRLNDDGTKDTTFLIGTGFNNTVLTTALQTDGKILVGGIFTEFNGQTANHLIRLNANGTIDNSFNIGVGFNNSVETISIQSDGKILVGGSYTSFNNVLQNFLVRLNADGTIDNNFVFPTAFNNKVSSIAIRPDGKIYVGGNFTTFNGITQNRLILLNSDGTKSDGFDIGNGYSFNIIDIAIQSDGKILIAGLTLIRLNSNGTEDTAFNNLSNFNGIKKIAIQENGKIVVGGEFVVFNGVYQNRIVRLNSDGTKDTSFDNSISGTPGLLTSGFTEGSCNDLKIREDGKIWAGGSFFHYKGVSSFSAIRLVGDSTLSANHFEANHNKVLFYPNPVKDILYLNEFVNNIILCDFTGKVLETKTTSNQIDFSKYSGGIYFISFENLDGFKQTLKIVKT